MSEVKKMYLFKPELYYYEGYVIVAAENPADGSIGGTIIAKELQTKYQFQVPYSNPETTIEDCIKQVVDEWFKESQK
jgi:hypothetical protein